LARCDGRGGNPAYVAFEGLVYDVTGSFLWNNGLHQGYLRAGRDLTEQMKLAPHGREVLDRFRVAGKL